MERSPPDAGQPAEPPSPAVDRRAAEREARLAAALRANLRRRKAQSRARQGAGEGADARPRGESPPPVSGDEGRDT
jgi:hypothetical protein